jgi:hypothetical protein
MEIYKRSLFLKRNLTLQSSYIDLIDEKHENTIFKSLFQEILRDCFILWG